MRQILKFLVNFSDFRRRLIYILFVSFLISFSIARLYSTSIGGSIYFKGFHIHHFYFGTVVLCIGGILGILTNDKKLLHLASVFIGIGMGLFADEIGLLLNCTSEHLICQYYFPDFFDIIGTISAIIILLSVLIEPVQKAFDKRRSNTTIG